MSWPRALKETARSGLTIERGRLEPLIALRGAAGVAIVVGLTLWLVSPAFAASSAFGAFSAGAVPFRRSWRSRPVLALLAGSGLAVSTFVGYLAVPHIVLFMALLAVWTFLAGMAWAAGTTAGIMAALNVGIMLVTVTLPTSVPEALGHAAVIAAGGVVQAALIVLFPVRSWGRHRDALADAVQTVADYALRLRDDPFAPFDPEPLMTARHAAAVTPGQARRRPAELHGSRGLVERIRPVLASLADPAIGAESGAPERERVRELLAATGSVLEAVARSIRQGEPAPLPAEAVATLRIPVSGTVLTGPMRRAAVRLVAPLGELVETVYGGDAPALSAPSAPEHPSPSEPSPAPAGPPPEAAPRLHPTVLQTVPMVLREMRREMRHDSPVLRHALRLTVVVVVGYALGSVLPLGHGYWAPLTSVMVMQPDFHQTYARSVARLAGTIVGVGVATGVVRLTGPDTVPLAVLAMVSAAAMYLVIRTGYAVSQACAAMYVVFLLSMGGTQWTQTVPERVLLTLLGGALAMVAYAVYPAWETPRLRDRLADWLEATGRYTAAVVAGYADPAVERRAEVRRTLLAARSARADWKEAVDRAALEPVRHRGLSRAAADDADKALPALARAAMLLEGHLPGEGARPVPGAGQVAESLRAATERGARAVRQRQAPRWDDVAEALESWASANVQDPVVRRGAELVLEALEDFTAAVGASPLERGEPG
ncbi:FUSC family protein [Streptomyces sp. NPDC018031]|uniref:FUSC family protein n=1 Tax=Streptomyces sp. NPDC018031 TaxID=3365033 RepID=UPI0037A28CAA